MTKKRKATTATRASKSTKARAKTCKNTSRPATKSRSSAPMRAPKPKFNANIVLNITTTTKPNAAAQTRKPKPKTPQKTSLGARPKNNIAKSNNRAKSVKRKRKARPDKQPPKRKNVSQRILNGTMIHTRDEYLGGAHGFNKNGATEYYRQAIVVDSNRKNDLALIKLTMSGKGESVPGLKKSKYKPYIEIKDNEGRPIRISKKFIKGRKKQKVSATVANEMKKTAVLDEREGERNRNKLKRLKKRK